MEQQAPSILLICVGFLLADFYLIGGIRAGLKKWKFAQSRTFTRLYWLISAGLIIGVFLSIFRHMGLGVRSVFLLGFFLMAIGKMMFLPFILTDDIRRLVIWFRKKSQKEEKPLRQPGPYDIPRSEFLMKAGLLAGSIPLGGIVYGTISGVYDYQVKHRTLYLPNLPKAFDGIKLGQISDIHSGSFYNKRAVTGGVEMLMKEKPDFIFFTGDLVNSRTSEMSGYQDIFSKVKAPLGVYSSLGNHDYGDYAYWPTEQAWQKNFQDILDTHKNMGWDLLRNENRRLKVNGEEIGILGVENWGSLSRFPKRGRLDLATKNTNDLPVKLLLSHDPSHWRAQVLDYPDIDVMFAGHTHGMQFGVQTKFFQWSPIQYIYKEWAGLYRERKQQLYVNVGYGFLGYPGRLGMLPEITIFELKAAADPSLSNKV
ncbi:metallophosphoesterase [Mucilaginibacter sp. BT774]|uniref:metallophosphoesterase n=1 Tax=Mucilaginibacter sp. BT774 TaxID=3062276 RepID=UPI002674CF5A|nr:metallophosphoesterase [Mucilaginibacter sp. BT774]MDO3626934.1 metallophosphoesterase [Mucilaginibacter sp. BT774]